MFIICIKKFSTNYKESNKIPLELDFQKYSIKSSNTVYRLSSTIEHVGSLNYGHYYTIILHKDSIYQIDDQNIENLKDIKLNDTNTYILYYQQIIH